MMVIIKFTYVIEDFHVRTYLAGEEGTVSKLGRRGYVEKYFEIVHPNLKIKKLKIE